MDNFVEVLTTAALPATAFLTFLGLFFGIIKQWIISQKDFLERKRMLNDQMLVTTAHTHDRLIRAMFDRFYDMGANKQDEQSRSVPSLDIEYVQRLSIAFCDTIRLEKNYEDVKRWYGFYIVCFIAGVLLVIASAFFAEARPYISVLSAFLVVVLLISLPRMRKKEANLERVENRLREQNPANAQRENIN